MIENPKSAGLRSPRGFTLLELLAVMAIVAVLAGIVTTSVSGTSDASKDAQAIQDSSTIGGAAIDYFADQNGVEILTPMELPVLGIAPNVGQSISSRWPETFITTIYRDSFPPDAATTVTEISFLDEEGNSLVAINEETNLSADFAVPDLLAGFTAIDFRILSEKNYLASVPDSVSKRSGNYSNYLWLLEKADSTSTTGKDASRHMALFKLAVVQKVLADSEQVSLIYQRLN